ncbi:hypothetical protein LEP3755_63540 (plasmid) [Leptolyngbya sp. NIES-3755]|nr:hypothetical protein LEP3755_63540 [Leptolyngbya sp. NIES-3755]
MSQKMRRYGMIGFMSIATVVTIAVARNPRNQPAIAESEHSSHTQMNGIDHSMMPGMSHGDNRNGHSSVESTVTTQAALETDGNLIVNQPKKLTIAIQDAQGKAISKFDPFQEKLMHLIVVSNDLQVFQHLHPTYKDNGQFEVETALPQAGTYTLISDYKPAGKAEAVSLLKVQVPGTPPATPAIDLQRSKTIDATKVDLSLSAPTVKAGQEVTIAFDLKDTSGKPIQDLKPYLGEQGHLVVLRQSEDLTKADYVHAHAMKGTPAGRVEFMAKFPQPGKYKLWGQFNRNGKIVVSDFWLDVQ